MTELRSYLSICKLSQREDMHLFRFRAAWADTPPKRETWRAPDFFGVCMDMIDAERQAFSKLCGLASRRRRDAASTTGQPPSLAPEVPKVADQRWAAAHLRTVQGKRTWPAARAKAPQKPKAQWTDPAGRTWTSSDADFEEMRRRWERDREADRRAKEAWGHWATNDGPTPSPASPKTPPCFDVLGLAYPATEATIKGAFRRLALVRHPDHGGTHEGFVALTRARDEALRYVVVAV